MSSYQYPSTSYRASGGGNAGSGNPSIPAGYTYPSGGSGVGPRGSDDERMLMRKSHGPGGSSMSPGGLMSGPLPPPSPYSSNLHQFQYSPFHQQQQHHHQLQQTALPLHAQSAQQASPRFGRHVYEGEPRYDHIRYPSASGSDQPPSPSAAGSTMAYMPYQHARSRSVTPNGLATGVAVLHGGGREASAGSPLPAGLHPDSATPPLNAGSSARVAKACVPCSTKKRRCDGGKPECKVCTVLGTPCSYENRGLKRGPPKGFRAGPKESARAKLLRSLETTIRDLSVHIGASDASAEIIRISSERGITLASENAVKVEPTTVHGGRRGSKTDLDIVQHPSTGPKRVKRESSAPVKSDAPRAAGASDDDDSQEEEVLGISESGNVRHFGSSSGLSLLQHRPPPLRHHHSDSTSSLNRSTPLNNNQQRTPSSSSDWRSLSSPSGTSKPPIPLPTVQSRLHGGSGTSTSFSPQASPAQKAEGIRHISREMNRMLFAQFWTGFHIFWPVLYKPGFDNISIDLLPSALDNALLNAIYAIGACVACPSLDGELEAELGDAPPGEVFAQRAEAQLFQRLCPPLPTLSGTQTCFLLSLYNQGAGQLSKAYLYCSLAVSMAIDLGLHRHLRHHDSDLIERESRSRLIHCLHILSTLLAAEMGRPPMLRGKDIDVPLLSETESDEFERDSNGRTVHALSCLNCSRRLFGIVETVLSQIHSFRRKAVLRRMGSDSTRKLVEGIYEELLAWRRSLPLHMRMPPTDGSYNYQQENAPLPSFAAVHVWYHTAMLLLHRPFIPHDDTFTLYEVVSDINHQRCTFAAQELFELLSQLSRSSDVERLSTDLAYVIFTAAVMFVFNSRLGNISSFAPEKVDWTPSGYVTQSNSDPATIGKMVHDAKRQFLMCKEWLKSLSERWPAASAHRQLLDGFASVGEGVIGGESGGALGLGISSRPQTAQGGFGRGVPDFASNAQFDPQHPGYSHTFFAPDAMPNSRQGITIEAGQELFEQGIPSDQLYDRNQFIQAAGGGSPELINNSSVFAVPGSTSQQALSAYFELAPNIFDMENVFWNETATRMTPYFGPVPDANAANPNASTDAAAKGALASQQQGISPQPQPQQQMPPTNGSPYVNTPHSQPLQAHHAQSSSAPPPDQNSLLSPRAQLAYVTQQQRQRGNSESIRRSSSLRNSSGDAYQAPAQTPASRSTTSMGSFSDYGLPNGSQFRQNPRTSYSERPTPRKTSSSSGLAILAQQAQAVTSSDNGVQNTTPLAPSSMPMSAASMAAPALPRESPGGGAYGRIAQHPPNSTAANRSASVQDSARSSNSTPLHPLPNSAPQHMSRPGEPYSSSSTAPMAPALQHQNNSAAAAHVATSGAPPNQAQPPTFSPFSLHQEPTAPEWGDVMSMLQLPPAFSQ